MSVGRRATGEQDKAERRRQILEAAAQLFDRSPFAAITMDAIAARAGLAKGTLYLYFRTKEELFLQLVLDGLGEWLEALPHALADADPARIGAALARTLAARPAFVRLLSILHTALEQNIDVEAAAAFKRVLRERMDRAASLLEPALPMLRPGEGQLFLMRLHVLVVGLHGSANPAPAVAEALKRPDLALFRIEFENELAALVTTLLCGWDAARDKP
jgi:AcrR family transcriptional regulator